MSTRQRIAQLEAQLYAEDGDIVERLIETIRQMDESVGGDPQWEPTDRWTHMRWHAVQSELWLWSPKHGRFAYAPAGRRSGKTELAKRRIVREACRKPGRYAIAAPTRPQVQEIYWEDVKALVPPWMMDGEPYESDLSIHLKNGSQIKLYGMEKPKRIEGSPLDGVVLDEYADMKKQVWGFHVRPTLSDRQGWAWLIGVPEGRNHYFDACEDARSGKTPSAKVFSWPSSDILPPEEIVAAKQELDELTYQQEYEASFITLQGRVYYPFDRATHCKPLEREPHKPLILMFDFNVEPGVCAYGQEFDGYTGIVGEVYIPRNSSTASVCRKILADVGSHKGDVLLYGDPAGGSRSTKYEDGSDWDIIRAILKPHFTDRLKMRVDKQAPRVKARINAVNSRLKTVSGDIKFFVDATKAPNVVKDLEAVTFKEGADYEIDSQSGKVGHITDAIGYYIELRFPCGGDGQSSRIKVY